MKSPVIILIIFVHIILFYFSGCGNSGDIPDHEKVIYDAVEAAEERDVDRFISFVSPDYYDSEERTIEEIEERIDRYFNRFRTISVNILSIKTVTTDERSAHLIAEINFSSGLGKMLSKIVKSYGETYRFNISLIKDKKIWFVKDAEWTWVSIEELYPESMKILKELFPNTF